MNIVQLAGELYLVPLAILHLFTLMICGIKLG